MDEQEQPRWRRWGPWIGGIVLALALAISLYGGYRYGWKWRGLVKDISVPMRTLWDWLQLLIIPAVLAGGGLWFNRQQRKREMEIAEQRAKDEAFQAYLVDQMSQLLADKERLLLRARPGDNLSTVARARTLTVLRRLDALRKGRVVQFLHEAGLITRGYRVIDLCDANLNHINLSRLKLNSADLSQANLAHAKLFLTTLLNARLHRTNLYEAVLDRTHLNGADLSYVQLENANLRRAHLDRLSLVENGPAYMREPAYMRGANLPNADLTEADLRGVNLSGLL